MREGRKKSGPPFCTYEAVLTDLLRAYVTDEGPVSHKARRARRETDTGLHLFAFAIPDAVVLRALGIAAGTRGDVRAGST